MSGVSHPARGVDDPTVATRAFVAIIGDTTVRQRLRTGTIVTANPIRAAVLAVSD